MTNAPRKPDYKLAAMNIVTGKRAPNVGGGWVEADESISIYLDPYIQLNNDDGNLRLRLFPYREDQNG